MSTKLKLANNAPPYNKWTFVKSALEVAAGEEREETIELHFKMDTSFKLAT